LALDESKKPEDNLDEAYGVKILADQEYAQFLKGAVIDYIDNEHGSGFQIKTSFAGDGCSSCSSCGSES